jgi:SNF2 family DNA or RNA helicase
MGLGKTVQTVAMIGYLTEYKDAPGIFYTLCRETFHIIFNNLPLSLSLSLSLLKYKGAERDVLYCMFQISHFTH